MENDEEIPSYIERLTLRRARLSVDSNVEIDTEFSKSTKTSAIKANVMCSDVDGESDGHFLLLDIDYPIEILQSSSGNNHLIFPRYLSKNAMLEILDVLGKHGIVQKKWAESAREHGYATLRLPGIQKYNDEDNCGLDGNGEIESPEEYGLAVLEARDRQWKKLQELEKNQPTEEIW